VQRKEREYVAILEAAITTAAESNQMKRNLDHAQSLAFRALTLYGGTFQPEILISAIIPIAQVSSITFALRDSVIEEVRTKGGGHKQHENTIWDEEIVASTSIYSKIRGKEVVLVTAEPRLINAASRASASDLVLDLDAYEKRLGLDPWPSKHDQGASGSA
jgi:hypothetical protein